MRLFYVDFLPGKWQITKLGDISFVTKLAGFEYTKHFDSYKVSGEIIVIRGTNITNNKLDTSDVKTIPKRVSDLLPRSKLNKGDLTFAYVGTIGPVFLIDQNNKYHLGPNTAKISPSNDVDPRYMFQYFTSNLIRREINENISVGAQPSLSMKKIRSFNIILPPLKEQQKIATALSDMDDLIDSLEKIIDKKKKIKQGTMQQLLTGKKRLPGFTGKWKKEKIENISSIQTGNKNTEDKIEGGKYPFYVRSSIVERIDSYTYDEEAVLTAGDGVGTGKVFHYVNGKFDLHQRVYKISDFDSSVEAYYFYLYFSNNFLKRIKAMSAKSSVDSVRREMISEMDIKLPSIEEQKAISQVLLNMDAEIESLEKKLEKYKKLKEGMMQELLTGRIRLV